MYRVLAGPSTSDLTTLASIKRELAIADDDTSQDDRLADLISTASDIVSGYCNRDTFGLETIEQTEYIREPGHGIALVGDLNPTVTSVVLNDTDLDETDYTLDGSILRRAYPAEGGWGWGDGSTINWPTGWNHWHGWPGGKVVITYTSGFVLLDELPRAIERACQDVVFSLWRTTSSTRDQTIRSETVDGIGSTTYSTGTVSALPIAPDRLAVLDRYKRRVGF
jgi:hypothetical protein